MFFTPPPPIVFIIFKKRPSQKSKQSSRQHKKKKMFGFLLMFHTPFEYGHILYYVIPHRHEKHPDTSRSITQQHKKKRRKQK
jgi:hypothetical protein